MEHDLIVFVCCVQRMGSSGISYSKKKNKTKHETTVTIGKIVRLRDGAQKKKKGNGLG